MCVCVCSAPQPCVNSHRALHIGTLCRHECWRSGCTILGKSQCQASGHPYLLLPVLAVAAGLLCVALNHDEAQLLLQRLAALLHGWHLQGACQSLTLLAQC